MENKGNGEITQIKIGKGDLAYWADMAFQIEHPRVATQVSITHLKKLHRYSPEREKFLELALGVESFVDGMLSELIIAHPTWPWASRSKGIGKENYPKVVGLIEAFGKFYDVGDLEIPSYVHRAPEHYFAQENRKGKLVVVEKVGVWVSGIERLMNPSKLWKYEGFAGPDQRRIVGQKLTFNAELRMALYRLGVALNRATGVWYTGSSQQGGSPGYLGYRARIVERKPGIKVVPTPKGRMCFACNIEVKEKDTRRCPQCGEKLSLKIEPEGYLYEGHLHMMALREMLKDFSTCIYIIWREALGLPISQPYEVEKLEHPPIDPWVMVDR